MTDYNDGEWHGWNGGECPVHPRSEVKVIRPNVTGGTPIMTAALAEHIGWNTVPFLFRVTKPYREPRVIWVNEYGDKVQDGVLHTSEESARKCAGPAATRIAVRFVESPE